MSSLGFLIMPPDDFGIAATAWTARLAMVGYASRLWIDVAYSRSHAWQWRARWCWTLGLALFGLHVVGAFHYYHHWSHAVAWEHTRQQTLERTGFNSGGGLWLNYLFLALWAVDLCAWWINIEWPKARLWYIGLQAFMAFMALNATAVFGPAAWIPLTLLYLAALLWKSRTRDRTGENGLR